MKKGFTLVELLAVIALLALFALIAMPVVDNILDKQKERIYKSNIETIKDALKNWANENISFLPESGEELNIALEDLKDEGLIDRNFKNPKTKKCYANSNTFKIKNVNDVYIYEVNNLTDGNNNECKPVSYVYYQTVGGMGITRPNQGLTERPTQYKTYLKYPVLGDTLGRPLACHYDEGQEFCLKVGNYKLSRLKLIEYYGPNKCTYNDYTNQLGCGNDIVGAGAYEGNTSGDQDIFTGDMIENIVCFVMSSAAGCTTMN